MAPNCLGTMASMSPWHCKIGRFLLQPEACRTKIQIAQNETKTKVEERCHFSRFLKCDGTEGKLLWSGSQQLRATTPANGCWQVKAVYKDKAPPWGGNERTKLSNPSHQLLGWKETSTDHTCEKPPRMMRLEGIPFLASCSIMALTGERQTTASSMRRFQSLFHLTSLW